MTLLQNIANLYRENIMVGEMEAWEDVYNLLANHFDDENETLDYDVDDTEESASFYTYAEGPTELTPITVTSTGYVKNTRSQFQREGYLFDHLAMIFHNFGIGLLPPHRNEANREALLAIAHHDAAARSTYLIKLINDHNYCCDAENKIYLKDLPSTWEWVHPEMCSTVGTRKQLFNTGCGLSAENYFYLHNTNTLCGIKERMCTTPVLSGEAPCEILNYSTRVEQHIPTDIKKGDTLFGIELELDKVNPTILQKSHEFLKKHCIFKRDGSVSNGVEIVSKPATIAQHKEVFKPFFDAKCAGLVATTNCGIHVHVSRGHFGFMTLGRLNAFMHKNKAQVVKIAGRESSYAQFNRNSYEEGLLNPWYSASGNKYDEAKTFTWDKYTCLNLTPRHTMEFRIYKSTTDWEEFCRFLEFTEAVVSYCNLAGNDNKGKIRGMKDFLSFQNFADFVAARGSAYPSLNKFIKKELS